MQPSNPMQPRGSFAKPPQLAKSIEEHEVKRGMQEDSPKEDPTVKAGDAAETAEQVAEREASDLRAKTLQWRKEIETSLNIEVTEANIRDYVFKGTLSKEVTIVPGILKGTLRTITGAELQAIDEKMAKVRDLGKFTPKGLENEEAIFTLSCSWTHADGRELGKTPEDREVKIRQMGMLVLEQASTARTNFDTLIRLIIRDQQLLKK